MGKRQMGGVRIHRDDKANRKSADAAGRRIQKITDLRRTLVGKPSNGSFARIAPDGVDGTIHPHTLRNASDDPGRILKPGGNNGKIGGVVMVGRLRGAPIYTLTLEERKTCPTSCPVWDGCYGNNMGRAVRYRLGADLIDGITAECEDHNQRGPFLVRLHILGDFFAIEYVRFWESLLMRLPNLHVFGFTAWPPETPIGIAIADLRDRYGLRWSIRHSGRTGPWGSFVIPFPTDEKRIGDAIVCPAQLDANDGSPKARHCGNCSICWASSVPIAFIRH